MSLSGAYTDGKKAPRTSHLTHAGSLSHLKQAVVLYTRGDRHVWGEGEL